MASFICFGVDTLFLWQVDWYCCNVGSYHAKLAMDPSKGVADDEDIKRWVVDEDAVVAGAVAKAVGLAGLDVLVEHFTSKSELLSAAKLQWAIANAAGTFLDEEPVKAALALIDDNGLSSEEAQQLVSLSPRSPWARYLLTNILERATGAGHIATCNG